MTAPWRLLALPGLGFGSFLLEGLAAARRVSPYADVPPVEPSLRVVAEAALDRSFSLGMNLITGVPHPTTMRRAQAEAQAIADVRNKASEVALLATARLIGTKLDDAGAQVLIDQTIDSLPTHLN